jgi:hypothetical protein
MEVEKMKVSSESDYHVLLSDLIVKLMQEISEWKFQQPQLRYLHYALRAFWLVLKLNFKAKSRGSKPFRDACSDFLQPILQ